MTSSHEERKTYDPEGVPHQSESVQPAVTAKPNQHPAVDDQVVTTGTAAGEWTPPARPASDDWLSSDRSFAVHDVVQTGRWRGEAPRAEQAVVMADSDGDRVTDAVNTGEPVRQEVTEQALTQSDELAGGSAARADDVLSQDIAQRVMATDYIDVSHVHVAVARANVILTGSVLTERQLKEIEALVAGCHGVRRIDNRLRIQRTAG